MQDDEFISDEELEYNYEKLLRYLENCPDYMLTSWEDFICNSKAIDAKRLWLQFTEKKETIPDDVTAVLFEAIKKEVNFYDLNHPRDFRKLEKIFKTNHLFQLLNTAKTDEDGFWKLLHGDSSSIFQGIDTGNKDFLDTLRKWLPERKDFATGELYAIFDELSQGKVQPPIGPPYYPRDGFVQAFRHWRKNNRPKS